MIAAVLETVVPCLIGRLVTILTETLFATTWPTIAAMLFIMLMGRPFVLFLQRAVSNHGISPPLDP